MQRLRLISCWIAAAWLIGGCRTGAGSGEQPQDLPDITPLDTRPITPPPENELPPVVLPKPPGSGGPAAFEGTAGVVDKPRPGAKVAVLREVRAAEQEGYDRVVFEFAGDDLPGYHVQYVEKAALKQCGSGQAVAVAGKAWLEVRLSPAQAHDDAGKATITDRERKSKLGAIQEMELTCDFEAQVTWVLGVPAATLYRVSELSKPTRIVVDIQR